MGGAGNLLEGVGVAAVEPSAVGVLDGLQRLAFLQRPMIKIVKTNIATAIAGNVRSTKNKSADLRSYTMEAMDRELDKAVDSVLFDYFVAQLLKRR